MTKSVSAWNIMQVWSFCRRVTATYLRSTCRSSTANHCYSCKKFLNIKCIMQGEKNAIICWMQYWWIFCIYLIYENYASLVVTRLWFEELATLDIWVFKIKMGHTQFTTAQDVMECSTGVRSYLGLGVAVVANGVGGVTYLCCLPVTHRTAIGSLSVILILGDS